MGVWRELIFSDDAIGDVLVIEDDRAKVLADPLRWRILEALGEGRSVEELSKTLEVTDARVLYHLKRLAQTGVVMLEEDATPPRAWRCVPTAGKLLFGQHYRNVMKLPKASQTMLQASSIKRFEKFPRVCMVRDTRCR